MAGSAEETNDPLDDLLDLEITGEGSVFAIADAFPAIPADATVEEADAVIYDFQTGAQLNYAPAVSNFVDETTNALADAINNGIVPPAQAGNFWLWLTVAGVTLIPAANAYQFVAGWVVNWAQSMGWATLVGPPAPTPAVQALIESANAAAPQLPVVQVPPAVLPSPSQGQTTTVGRSNNVVPRTITGGVVEGVTAAEVSAALSVTFVDTMQVLAGVVDDMLPGMAPGQVPEALSQQNTAINALENQMGQVRRGMWPRGFVGLQEAVGGALQALNGLSQEVGILANQMAEKADSALEDGITAISNTVSGIGDQVTALEDTTIPELAGGLTTLTGTVGALESLVDGQVVPGLTSVTNLANDSAAKLALTDDACLEALCDAETNVTQPIKDGGADASLLKKLGAALGLAWLVGTVFTIGDAIITVLDAPMALAGVAQDVEQLSAWAESAATTIESVLPVQ